MKKLFICCVLYCFILIDTVYGQEQTNLLKYHLSIQVGQQTQALLDKQASPLLYTGSGPSIGLTYLRLKPNYTWSVKVNGGLLDLHPDEESLQFEEGFLSTIVAGLELTYYHVLTNQTRIKWWIGGKLKEDLMVDLNYEIGNWPYAFASGGLFASIKGTYEINSKHFFSTSLDLPILNIVTDMPYVQIPRLEGKYPDVPSLFKIGTRMPYWNSFQRFDFAFSYKYQLNGHWGLSANYAMTWIRDEQPKLMKSSNSSLEIGCILSF